MDSDFATGNHPGAFSISAFGSIRFLFRNKSITQFLFLKVFQSVIIFSQAGANGLLERLETAL